jgi:gliding motility-associated lipoprotein GldH
MNDLRKLSLALALLWLASCNTLDVFEKEVPFPTQEWSSSVQPSIHFQITDTSALYNVYLIFRHSDAYSFNNIWMKWTIRQPGDSVARSQQFDLKLANNQNGWLGSGMDDIWEHRILLQSRTNFHKAGDYQVDLTQMMRQDPLQHVLNVGLRVEKIH